MRRISLHENEEEEEEEANSFVLPLLLTFLALVEATHDQVLGVGGGGVGREAHEHGLVHFRLQFVLQEVLPTRQHTTRPL